MAIRNDSHGRTRRRIAAVVAVAVGLAVAPPVAAVDPAAGRPVAASALAEHAFEPGAQDAPAIPDDPTAGPYDPGFVDDPRLDNPPSPRLDDLDLSGDELDARRGDLDAAEARRDDAADELDAIRDHRDDLATERVRLAEELEAREADVVARREDRRRAHELHVRRTTQAQVAADELEDARALLRDLVIAAYVSESSAQSDVVVALTGTGAVDDAVLRLALGDGAATGREADVRRLSAALDRAEARRDAARDALEAAREEEARSIDARDATLTAIADNEAAQEAARVDEQDAVEVLARRDRDVLVALVAVAPARLRADVVGDGIDFPLVALDAWVKAAEAAPCRVEWWALAGISRVESGHGTHGGGRLGARGYPSVRIVGPRLDGSFGFARIRDTDGGRWDGDTGFDRAVGPMQFIPSTWSRWGADGDGDGVADPNTIYDAAAAAARYLCAGRSDLTDEAQLRSAYFSYNHSDLYVAVVLAAAHGYRDALTVPPPEAPPA